MATPEPKAFDMGAIKPFYAGVDESKLANVGLRLPEGRCHKTKQSKRLTARLNRTRSAIATVERLPNSDESLHCILNGEFALWDFVPAILELSGKPIAELWLATLGFSKANVEALAQLVDAGQVGKVHVLCSHYFAAADSDIYSQMVELCTKRSFRIAAMRTHAKVLLLRTGKHRIVVESSANLRSCHNIEQATVFNDAELYYFHAKWIDEVLSKGTKT